MQHSILRSAFHFLTGTLISRFGGFARDVLMAFYFGTFAETAAFFVAYRMANLFRRIFAEGAILNGFVPFYERITLESSEKGLYFFRDLSFFLSLFLIGFIGLIEVGLWFVYPQTSSSVQYILKLSAIMLPSLLFICLFGLFNSYLQCKGKFFTSGVIPFSFNLVWIGSIILVKNFPIAEALTYISIGIFFAYLIQWIVVFYLSLPFLRKEGSLTSFLKPKFFPSEVRLMIKPFLASVIGVSAMQINSGMDVIFARIASLEGPAYLSYAIRLEQLPIAFFGVSVASALLPLLSKKFELGLKNEMRSTLLETLSKVMIVLVFCTFALFSLGFATLNVIYARGGFNEISLHYTLRALWMYGIGLIPACLVIILAPVFYAQKDFKTPMRGSLVAVFFNLVLNSIFVFILKSNAEGIALATSISSWVNCLYLFYRLSEENLNLLPFSMIKNFSKSILIASVALLCTQGIGFIYLGDTSLYSLFSHVDNVKIFPTLSFQISSFSLLGFIYCSTFFVMGIIGKLFSLQDIYASMQKKFLAKREQV